MWERTLVLNNITLIAVASTRVGETVAAMKHCMNRARFANALLFTDQKPDLPPSIRLIPTPRMESVQDWCETMMRYIPTYSDEFESHVLSIHWDGYIINPEAWTREFLWYDYIGAPWGDGAVGNSGFCLRSVRLMRTILSLRHEMPETWPDDVVIGRTYRGLLESKGIRFPTAELALKFSTEDRTYAGSFGYHGWRCVAMTDQEDLTCDFDLQDHYNCALLTPSDINEHIPTLYRLGKECSHITEFCHRTKESTAAFLYTTPKRMLSYNVEGEHGTVDITNSEDPDCDYEYRPETEVPEDPEPTDLLFIDSLHSYSRTKHELAAFANRVRKYIVFHDTETFGERSRTGDEAGIWPAIEEFLDAHPEWAVREKYKNNNGLTVLVRLRGARF